MLTYENRIKEIPERNNEIAVIEKKRISGIPTRTDYNSGLNRKNSGKRELLERLQRKKTLDKAAESAGMLAVFFKTSGTDHDKCGSSCYNHIC